MHENWPDGFTLFHSLRSNNFQWWLKQRPWRQQIIDEFIAVVHDSLSKKSSSKENQFLTLIDHYKIYFAYIFSLKKMLKAWTELIDYIDKILSYILTYAEYN